MKIRFYLMMEKGYTVLQHLVQSRLHAAVDSVVAARDRNLANDYYEEIRLLCSECGIPFFDRKEAAPAHDGYAIAISWRWLIADNTRLIVFHDSILPKYRGFAPLVSCLVNGEPEVGVTALLATEGYDEGPVLGCRKIPVAYPTTIAAAIEAIAVEYSLLAADIVAAIQQGNTLTTTEQHHQDATYSLWRDEDDFRIDWQRDAAYIRRFIDATGHPYKGAKTQVNGQWVRVHEASECPDVVIENRTPGKVIFVQQGHPVVVCGQGLLKITHATFDQDGQPALPLSQFRTRFQS